MCLLIYLIQWRHRGYISDECTVGTEAFEWLWEQEETKNSTIRVEQFETQVREHGRITLNREGDDRWFLDVLYLFDNVSEVSVMIKKLILIPLIDKYGLTDCNS